MNRFDPPGFVDDLTEEQRDVWNAQVVEWLGKVMDGKPADNDGPRAQFFNALATPPDADQKVATISWNAFPRQVRMSSLSDKQRWRRADASRDVQDEYCEWSVTRDAATGKITRVTFTCEGPEYWEKLAELNPQKVVALYRELISPAVQQKDLFVDGVYNPRNRFNNSTTNGAMHLIQRSNSLFAEIELGAAATIRRLRANGTEITDAQELIRCSQYGAPERNSDPFIGEQVNALARQGADITINNPIGLYLHEFNPVGWVTPDGADARDFWKFVRGKDDHFVRAVYEVPPERGYVVGDIKIDGRRIEFGAQITDFITIKLEGLATRFGKSTVKPFQGCFGAAAPPGMIGVAAAAAVAVAQPAMPTRFTGTSVPAVLPAVDDALLARLPEALRRDANLEEAAAPPAALQKYPPLPKEELVPRMVSGKIMAYASPDSTYAVTKKLLDAARDSIVIGIYDFRADYVKAHLKKAMQRGVRVTLMLDTNKNDQPGLFKELSKLGATCVVAPSDSSKHPSPYFDHAHEKIIVIDGEIVMIQSGNWSETSIPFNEVDGADPGDFTNGNREMGVAVHSRPLAKFFADLIARDIRLALGQPVDVAPPSLGLAEAAAEAPSAAAEIFFEAAPAFVPPQLFKSLTVTPSSPVSITPVLTPENFHDVAKNLLRSAKRSIFIEQQYIRGGEPAVEALLDAMAAARKKNPGLDVRVIVSKKYLKPHHEAWFVKAMKERDFEFDDNWRFLSLAHFVHCHNKLIVVDEEKVLVGSQNWSTTALLTNREAALLVEHAGIASYFADIFEADWKLSEPTDAPPFALAPEAIVTADAFAEGGVVISSVKDYEEV